MRVLELQRSRALSLLCEVALTTWIYTVLHRFGPFGIGVNRFLSKVVCVLLVSEQPS